MWPSSEFHIRIHGWTANRTVSRILSCLRDVRTDRALTIQSGPEHCWTPKAIGQWTLCSIVLTWTLTHVVLIFRNVHIALSIVKSDIVRDDSSTVCIGIPQRLPGTFRRTTRLPSLRIPTNAWLDESVAWGIIRLGFSLHHFLRCCTNIVSCSVGYSITSEPWRD